MLYDAEEVSLLQILVCTRSSKHVASGAMVVRFARGEVNGESL